MSSDPHSHEPVSHDSHDPHAPPANAHEIEHHIALYWKIGGILLVFTLITVALSYVNLDKLFHGGNMIIGMIVASFKVSLVAAIFMHLKQERATVWRFLYFTFFFVMGLFLLFWFAYADPIFGTHYWTH
ncbi:MAG: cytochrome C oxidase subunit IV family protein [Chthoniobacteraceae bacterium]